MGIGSPEGVLRRIGAVPDLVQSVRRLAPKADALEPLGFVLSSFVCMSVLFKAGNTWRWPAAVAAAAATVAIAYVVFVVLLNVPLPRGPSG